MKKHKSRFLTIDILSQPTVYSYKYNLKYLFFLIFNFNNNSSNKRVQLTSTIKKRI